MILKGKLIAESPIYRGNSRKTLFTRDGDGKHKLVSLPGEISGTAQALMDAFTGQSRNGKNIGLFDHAWLRLYGMGIPSGLIQKVECKLQPRSYQKSGFFDLRMGIRLDEDRWAAEANANYKMETLFRHSVFDFQITLADKPLASGDNQAKLFYLLEEMREARFWFGAGKSKGLGNLRLEMSLPFNAPQKAPDVRKGANHLRLDLAFDSMNPVLVGWNWGKIEPDATTFVAVEGKFLLASIKGLPNPVRDRLNKALGGPVPNPEDWKRKFTEILPRVIGIWFMEGSSGSATTWTLPHTALAKLSKGKHALAGKLISNLEPLAGQPFSSKEELENAIKAALEKKANMAKRVTDLLEERQEERHELDPKAWAQVASALGLDKTPPADVSSQIGDLEALVKVLEKHCASGLGPFYRQVDHQIKLMQSDSWVDVEVQNRSEHAQIKKMLLTGKISERQWERPDQPPEGISSAVWREFLDAHSRVQYRHMLNRTNLEKSITNDNNLIEFLTAYRDQTRQELSLPHHIDFRAGGVANRVISQEYGKPYDNIFMRMLSWAPSSQESGMWEIYVPGSTIKGAFRKRASQVIKTMMGESSRTDRLLDLLFGTQGQRGKVFFSDAYLMDPVNHEKAWCSMDGVRMDPKTSRPIEAAKHDYLFAYGQQLKFHFKIDMQDIGKNDMEGLTILWHLIQDFQRGDIPLGGERSNGFGWVEAQVNKMTWLSSGKDDPLAERFGGASLAQRGLWKALELEGQKAAEAIRPAESVPAVETQDHKTPPVAKAGFISHRAFGGHCGILYVETEVLTPLSVRESGGPSHTVELKDGPVNGWDFFSFSPPDPTQRASERSYAVPSRSIKGMLRHIYSIATDSRTESSDIARLNPADSLFGWVGKGPNNALTARLSISFARFEQPTLQWFEVPYPYGDWQFVSGTWKQVPKSSAAMLRIKDAWRLFPHAPLVPVAKPVDAFAPQRVDAAYFRAILPGAKARFSIRFWNLMEEELQRLLWCVGLEKGLAHKMGHHRYLGFGSLRMHIMPSSFLVDWSRRYAGKGDGEWQRPLPPLDRIDAKTISNHAELRKALNAEHL